MRKSNFTWAIIATFALTVSGGVVAAPSAGRASNDVPFASGISVISKMMLDAGPDTDGFLMDDVDEDAVTGISAGGPNGASICFSYSDEKCSPRNSDSMWVRVALGICESTVEIGCIETFGIRHSDGELEVLQLVGGGKTLVPENQAHSIPRGTTLTTWQDRAGSRYVLTPLVTEEFNSNGEDWIAPRWNEGREIKLVVKRTLPTWIQPEGSRPLLPSGTFSFQGGEVPYPLALEDGARFLVRMRLPTLFSGWFTGHLADATFGVTTPNSSSRTYSIEGTVVPTYIFGYITKGGRGVLGGADPHSIRDYEAISPAKRERSIATINTWRLRSISGPVDCLDTEHGQMGLASTNASIYESSPPTFDETTGAFSYNVAAPHLDVNGDVAVGRYSFALPLDAMQCLYGLSELPTFAQFSTAYSDGEPSEEEVRAVSIKDGYLNVSVVGFHYSSPRVRVSLGTLKGAKFSPFKVNKRRTLRALSSSVASFELNRSARRLTVTLRSSMARKFRVYIGSGSNFKLSRILPVKKGRVTFSVPASKSSTAYIETIDHKMVLRIFDK